MPAARLVPAAAEANKQGYLYIVNRQTGALIRASDPLGLESANMMDDTDADLDEPRYPAASGGADWSPPAYSPLTHEVYVNAAQSWPGVLTNRSIPKTAPTRQWIGGDMRVILDGKSQQHHRTIRHAFGG